MHQLVRAVVLRSLIVVYSLITIYKLLIIYVTKFSTQPWKLKDRSTPPACLSDPKYGAHKFAVVNVSNSNESMKIAAVYRTAQ